MIRYETRACGILYNLLRTLPGDRPFLLPANVCPVVPLTFRKAGRAFGFVDLDPEELGMSRGRCLDLVSTQPDAWAGVLYVQPYGAVTAGVEEFFRALKAVRPDLVVIDDRCLCPPDCAGESPVPGADLTLFSTGSRKPVDLGYGGFAHCRPGLPYRRHAASYSPAALDRVTRSYKEALAGASRCAAGSEGWLDLSPPPLGWEAYREAVRGDVARAAGHKQALSALYAAAIPAEIQLPARFQGWRFHILVPEPDRLIERLFAEGLFASRHYASLGGIFCAQRFAEADRIHRRIVNLFNDANYDESRALRTIDVVLRHLAEKQVIRQR